MKACLAIGVDRVDQAGTLAVLQDAAAGAERFYNWALGEGYDSKLLTDRTGPVTTALIKAEIRAFVNKGTYDQLLVYFAGHGILKSAYWEQWLLSDANNDPNEAVNLESSIKYGRNSRIPHLVFVSDACRSLTTDPNL